MSTSTASHFMVELPSESFASALKQTLQNLQTKFLLTHSPENVMDKWHCEALASTTRSFVREYAGSSGQAQSRECLTEFPVDCTIDISQVGLESIEVIAENPAFQALEAFASTTYKQGGVPSIEVHPEDGWLEQMIESYSPQPWEAGSEAEVIPQGGRIWQTQCASQAEPIKVRGFVRMDPAVPGLQTTGEQLSRGRKWGDRVGRQGLHAIKARLYNSG